MDYWINGDVYRTHVVRVSSEEHGDVGIIWLTLPLS